MSDNTKNKTPDLGNTQDLFTKIELISSKLEEMQLNPNLEDTKLKKHLDSFKLLKTDIKDLLEIKNPISFVIKLKNIKDKLFIHIENLVDYIESEFDNLDLSKTEKNELLYDLGFGKLLLNKNIKDYSIQSKYFYESLYFETYSIIDNEFKDFIQKIISLKDSNNLVEEILKNNSYKKYNGFLEFINKNNLSLSLLVKEEKFGYSIIKQICELDKQDDEKIKLLEEFYNFFQLKGLENIKYSKLIKLNTIINFDTLNDFKKDELINYQELLSKIDGLIANTSEYNFSTYINIYSIINSLKGNEFEKIRGYLWGYARKKIKDSFGLYSNNLDFEVYVSKKYDEEYWVENRLNYRLSLRNDETKLQKYELMDGFNQFRNIILNIQDAIMSDFYKVYIFRLLSDKLSLSKSTYYNLKFFMLFVLPKNYLEYCKIYTFFFEYDSYKNNTSYPILKFIKISSYFRLTIISLIIFSILIYYSTFYISWILSLGIFIFLLGQYFKRSNILNQTQEVRFHLGLNVIGLAIMFFYGFIYLSNNGFFQIKIDLIEKINKNEIVWQTLNKDKVYNNIILKPTNIITNVLQSKNIKCKIKE